MPGRLRPAESPGRFAKNLGGRRGAADVEKSAEREAHIRSLKLGFSNMSTSLQITLLAEAYLTEGQAEIEQRKVSDILSSVSKTRVPNIEGQNLESAVRRGNPVYYVRCGILTSLKHKHDCKEYGEGYD